MCLLLSSPVAATSVFNQTVSRAYSETIKLRISNGRTIIRQELQANPTNAAAMLVENQQDFLTLAVEQNPKRFGALLKAQENRLEQLASSEERSAWSDFALAEIRLQVALSKLLQDQKLAAAWDLRQAYLQYLSNARRYPNFLPNKKSLGALQVLIGSVPDSYKFFLNIIGMKGDIKTGMANLHTASSRENPFQEEAKLMYGLILHLVDQDRQQDAATMVYTLATEKPDNLLFSFVALHILKKNKQSDLAHTLDKRRPTGNAYISFPYLHHMAADLYLYKGDFENSIRENKVFLQQHKGAHYIKAAHYKLYLASWLNQQQQQAIYHRNLIRQVGKSVVEEDSYAQRYTEQQIEPNRHLLLARLQSDGGYYREALAVLQQMKLNNRMEQEVIAEYYYRKARIWHGLDEPTQAKQHYEQAILACENSTLYFAPNAALQLGYLYQQAHQIELARHYFMKALSYKGHAYKNSIDGKAKLALQTL
ncbi:tetratricopeptide repeat protein [Pontibacter aquaedesilientis]|uniref:DUF3808 domain-containing protein n=1 Tax=Pontibacter aquaedesilientis TaxID=2766980 RepID=UPI001CD0B8EF|nr:DUF3808 domain-containing protein [Pontibacter aquaedesilientis]